MVPALGGQGLSPAAEGLLLLASGARSGTPMSLSSLSAQCRPPEPPLSWGRGCGQPSVPRLASCPWARGWTLGLRAQATLWRGSQGLELAAWPQGLTPATFHPSTWNAPPPAASKSRWHSGLSVTARGAQAVPSHHSALGVCNRSSQGLGSVSCWEVCEGQDACRRCDRDRDCDHDRDSREFPGPGLRATGREEGGLGARPSAVSAVCPWAEPCPSLGLDLPI